LAVAVLGMAAGVASAGGPTGARIARGHLGERHWVVGVVPQGEHRKGIDFEMAIYDRTPRNLVGDDESISAPAPKRGIVSVEVAPGRGPDFPAISVVGMAMSKAVKVVEITYFDGSTRRIVPRSIRPGLVGGSTVANFDYFAYAVRGPWCAARLVTFDGRGEPLWEDESPESEFGGAEASQASCPGFTAPSVSST
jgi:hypothetical protein